MGVIFEINNCTDPKWRAFKIIQVLRGKAMEYFDTLPVEVSKDGELLCKEMFSCFDENEPGLSLMSKLYQVAQKGGGSHRRICGMGKMYDGEEITFFGKSRGRIICSRVLSQKTQGKKRTSLAVFDKAPDSIGRAVDWGNNFEANVSWVGED